MPFYKDERILLLIDGANLYAACRQLNIEIDYSKLLGEFRSKGRMLRANYYIVLADNEDNFSAVRPLVDWLAHNGFSVVKKLVREFADTDGRKRAKGSMDVDITIDALELAPYVDHIVLFTGNGDFRRLVEVLKAKGKRVSIVSTAETQPPVACEELRKEADNFIEIMKISDRITRPSRGTSHDYHSRNDRR